MKSINLVIRFLLELVLLAALAFWAERAAHGHSTLVRICAAVAAPAIVGIVWGLAISPKAPAGLSPITRLALSLPIFGLGALALYTAGETRLATIYGIVAAVNPIVLIILELNENH